MTQPLTEAQWAEVDQINADLTKEYSVRREMLLTRCDVTVQSFRWSDNVKVHYVTPYILSCGIASRLYGLSIYS